jgi:putative transposase
MSTPETRALVLDLIDEAVDAGARAAPACAVLGLTPRTLRRWRALAGSDSGLVDRRTCTPRVPANRLSPEEQETILTVCNEPEYRSLPPTQIVPRLADHGRYIASESSFYRVLRAHDQVHRRGRAAAPRQVPKPEGVCATAPNTAWCWDITFLASSIRGQFYRLYLIEDLFSRKIVGWEVHTEGSAAHASRLIERACLAEGVHRPGLVLHSDNGSPMKGATMLSTLQRLGVVPSFSRPSVSDDNPYAESLFRTLKYTPAFPPQPFASLADARAWVARFVHWYNEEHRHSWFRSTRSITPEAPAVSWKVSQPLLASAAIGLGRRTGEKRWQGQPRRIRSRMPWTTWHMASIPLPWIRTGWVPLTQPSGSFDGWTIFSPM